MEGHTGHTEPARNEAARRKGGKITASKSIRAIAIFPKQFELQGFLSTLDSTDYLVSVNTDEIRECYSVKIRINKYDLFLSLFCYVINSSDIEFSFDLGKLLEDTRAAIAEEAREEMGIDGRGDDGTNAIVPKLFVFLVGTAGTSNPKAHKLGDAFHVTTAIKVDRGTLTYEDGKLIMKGTKKSYARSIPDLGLATTISTNHIAHCESGNLLGDISDAKSFLMDMETFEFFKTCELNGVACCQCFRVVSDVFVGNESISVSDTTRKCVNFDKLRNTFVDYLKATLGHVNNSNNWRKLLIDRPHWRDHHNFLIDRFLKTRTEKLLKILTPAKARDVKRYAASVGGEKMLFYLVDELAAIIGDAPEDNNHAEEEGERKKQKVKKRKRPDIDDDIAS